MLSSQDSPTCESFFMQITGVESQWHHHEVSAYIRPYSRKEEKNFRCCAARCKCLTIKTRHFNYKWLSFAVFLRIFPCHAFTHNLFYSFSDAAVELPRFSETRADMKCVIYHFNKCFSIRSGDEADTEEGSTNSPFLHSLMIFRWWQNIKCSRMKTELSHHIFSLLFGSLLGSKFCSLTMSYNIHSELGQARGKRRKISVHLKFL